MLDNNNHKIITRMALRSMKGDRRRFGILVTAVLLSFFLLFCVLTVGVTYFDMQHVQNIRLNGGDYDAIVGNGFTREQRERCAENEEIAHIGSSAYAGYAQKTDADDTLHTALLWCDENHWEIQMKPARKQVEGHYPQKENELMVTREALKDCGKEQLNLGDSFTLTYMDNSGSHTREFKISGIWDGYGEKSSFYVSKDFYEKTGYELENNGILSIKFKDAIVSRKVRQQLENDLNLSARQYFMITTELEKSQEILVGAAGLILITCLSAYLLIYNILYLSVSGNIRYYGLLQTIGMSKRQIRAFLKKQMLLVGGIGISGGILLGIFTSFFLLPFVVQFLGIRKMEVKVSFHPVILLISVLIVGFTLYLGSRKPMKTAAQASPVEALRYRSGPAGKKRHKVKKGNVLWRMAAEQFFMDKKKTGIVVLSLATSLTVFLCVIVINQSHDARTIMSGSMDMDLTIRNDTLFLEDEGKWEQIMDESFLEGIKSQKGVAEVHPLLSTKIIVPWEPEFADGWMRAFYEVWKDVPYDQEQEEYKKHPENFYSFLKGIDEAEFEHLNIGLSAPVDKEQFLNGEVCVIYSGDLSWDMEKLKDKKVHYLLAGDHSRS